MPTVPTEQNRVGIAGVTDAKLQPGDYSGTGLQALGAGMRMLGATGQESADAMIKARAAQPDRPPPPPTGEPAEPQSHEAQHAAMAKPSPDDIRDDAVCKIAWNQFSDVCRGVWADLEGRQGFAATAAVGPAIEALDAGYKSARDMVPPELHPVYDRSAGERLPLEIAGMHAFGAAQSAVEQERQSQLLQANAAQEAIRQASNPDMFGRYVATGADSIVTQARLRGDDPATIERAVTAYRSDIDRRVLEHMTGKDPIAAATRYGSVRGSMTPEDQRVVERGLFEPLARALATGDVDRLRPTHPEGERATALTPEDRDVIGQAIETQPWTDARKRYAREDLATRGALDDRQRKQAAGAAKDKGLAIADQLGPDFTSLTQLPPEVRRDLDDDTVQTLGLRAQDNLDGKPVAPNGETSLMMNLIASQNQAAFAKEDLRLVRGKVTPEEYERFLRLQRRGAGDFFPSFTVAQKRAMEAISLLPNSIPEQPDNHPAWEQANGAVEAMGDDTASERTNGLGASPASSFPGAKILPASFDIGSFRAQGNGRQDPKAASTAFASGLPQTAPIAGRKAPEGTGWNPRRPHEIYVVDSKRYIGKGKQHIRSPEDQASNRSITEEDLTNPALMAFLTMISITEGPNGHYNYHERFGRKKLDDLSKFHYQEDVSDASGMFQIKGNTYDEIALAKLGLNDFSPQTQRMTAMFLLRQRHIRERLLVGDIRGAIDEGSREWASLPDPKTNESRYMKSGTDRRQSSVDLTKAIEMYGRLKTIWEKKLAPQASR